MTEQESPWERRLIAWQNRQMMAFYTLRRLAEHNRNVAHQAIESARLGVREWSDVGRRWAKRPTDVIGLAGSATETATKVQARSLELLQQWWEGVRRLAGR